MTRGIRFINGQEYMLAGRFDTKAEALAEKIFLLNEWRKVRVLRIPHRMGEYSCWVHEAL